jgi:hypothetical protein
MEAGMGKWAIVFLFLLWGCGSPATYALTYRVHGSGSFVSLTYEGAGGTEQIGNAQIPWSKSFPAKSGQFAYVAAQNVLDHGSVTCEILVDNVVVKTATSEGAYTIASCSGKL